MRPHGSIVVGHRVISRLPAGDCSHAPARIKIGPSQTFDHTLLDLYAKACGAVVARAHAKTGGVSEISGYLGGGDEFDTAMGAFGIAYADQAERDHAALKTAVRKGLVEVFREGT